MYIEIISDMTTEAFLARFVARRGLPLEIHSDNGTNVVGAKNDLHLLYRFLRSSSTESALNSYLLSHRIQWHCIPERAPHFRGLWEAAVKCTKYHLHRVVGTQRLTYEELATVTCQIESCLNSRPLTAIISHPNDGISVLTPGHFLIRRLTLKLSSHKSLPCSSAGPCIRQWSTIFGSAGRLNTFNSFSP